MEALRNGLIPERVTGEFFYAPESIYVLYFQAAQTLFAANGPTYLVESTPLTESYEGTPFQEPGRVVSMRMSFDPDAYTATRGFEPLEHVVEAAIKLRNEKFPKNQRRSAEYKTAIEAQMMRTAREVRRSMIKLGM